jgi:hypothetical protein
MSKQNEETTSSGEARVGARKSDALPVPPMLWLLIPVGLLALLAFLSRS